MTINVDLTGNESAADIVKIAIDQFVQIRTLPR